MSKKDSKDVCPECNGTGRWSIPSDGYENKKSGRCEDCRGDGTFLTYAKRRGAQVKRDLEHNIRMRDQLNKDIATQRKLIKRIDKALQNSLTPPDPERCQAEKGGAFMLGPGMVRCENKPVVIASELQAGDDGLKGSMSLCESCLEMFKKRVGVANHRFDAITPS